MVRLRYLMVVVITMLVGYQSRQCSVSGSIVHDYVGDAIWAAMIYAGFRMVLASCPPAWSAGAALLFCYLIEISQCSKAPWLEHLRHTTLGGLVLGFGFLWSDLVMYTIGISLAFWTDSRLQPHASMP